MDSQKAKSNFYLILAALIWGFAFVAQSIGLEHLGPFTFNAVRCIIGSIVLLPFIFFNSRKNKKIKAVGEKTLHGANKKKLLAGGLICGAIMCVASAFQQYGLIYTTVGKSGFITALYMVIVPLFGIFMKKRAGITVWISIAIAVIGMYLLCINENTPVNIGDVYTLLCALCFAFHILAIDYYAPHVDGITLSCIQFFVCAILSAVPMLIYETPSLENLKLAWLPIFYAGVLSCGIAYTMQILGQKNTKPTVASLILSLESVFALIGGMLIMHERPHTKELLGCLLMFAAIILSQLDTATLIAKFKKNRD